MLNEHDFGQIVVFNLLYIIFAAKTRKKLSKPPELSKIMVIRLIKGMKVLLGCIFLKLKTFQVSHLKAFHPLEVGR